MSFCVIWSNIHLSIVPLHLLHDIQRAVQDELVQVAGLVAEAREAVAALLRRAKLVLEQRVVLGANDGEVVGHCVIDRSFANLVVDVLY